MANLKNLRTRITSIKSTQKITKAMKMVAAAKVKRSENAAKASRPFSLAVGELIERMMRTSGAFDLENVHYEHSINNYPALLAKRPVKTVGLFVLTSNKGLAGAYNANIIRTTLAKVEEFAKQGIKCRLFIAGLKGIGALRRKEKALNFEIIKTYTRFPQEITFEMAQIVAEDLADEYVKKIIDKVEIVTTTFKNMMSYSVQSWDILPLETPNSQPDYTDGVPEPLMEIEPSVDTILQTLIPMAFVNIIFQAFREATASELASRMMAMSAATDNAEEMINKLTIDYNKIRQFAITQELIEIVGGAGALKK